MLQVGGFTEAYDGLRLATVRNAGTLLANIIVPSCAWQGCLLRVPGNNDCVVFVDECRPVVLSCPA